jgi:hypothetical protein
MAESIAATWRFKGLLSAAQWRTVGTAQRHPLLAEADAWAAEHRYLLTCCFEHFQEEGEWPPLEQLQHDFEVADRDEDVSQLAFAMPRPLGFVEQQRLVLLVRALSHVPTAAPLLEDWSAVLKFAYAKWRDDPNAELTRADALQVLDGDPQRTRFASAFPPREMALWLWPRWDRRRVVAGDHLGGARRSRSQEFGRHHRGTR